MSGNENNSEIAVLIPAAGSGLRMGGEPKQFRILGGKPLLVQTLLVFERHPEIDHIIVAVREKEVERLWDDLVGYGLSKLRTVVAGGATRQDSVYEALRVTPSQVEFVLVHDAVRPFITADQIRSVIQAVKEYGAAALAVEVSDTMRYGTMGEFADLVSRENLFRMQTPQGCRRSWFERAHERAKTGDVQATDDVDLIQRAGYRVRIVPGSPGNLKITTREDWALAEVLWSLNAR